MFENISVTTFCDMHGCTDFTRFIVEKTYKDQKKTYYQWHEEISKNHKIKKVKNFAGSDGGLGTFNI